MKLFLNLFVVIALVLCCCVKENVNAYYTFTVPNKMTTSSISCSNSVCYTLGADKQIITQAYNNLMIYRYSLESMFDNATTAKQPIASLVLPQMNTPTIKQFFVSKNNGIFLYAANIIFQTTDMSSYVSLTISGNQITAPPVPSITITNTSALISTYVNQQLFAVNELTNGKIPSGPFTIQSSYYLNDVATDAAIYDSSTNSVFLFSSGGIEKGNLGGTNDVLGYPSKRNALVDNINSRLYFMANVNGIVQVQGVNIVDLVPVSTPVENFNFTVNASKPYSSYNNLFQSTFDDIQGIAIFMYQSGGLSHLILVDTFSNQSKEINDLPKIRDTSSFLTFSPNPSPLGDSAVFYMISGTSGVSVPYENFCPGVCNYQGVCRLGVCVCNEGTFGASCGELVPVITNVTKVSIGSQDSITITGTGLSSGSVQFDNINVTVISTTYSAIVFTIPQNFSNFNADNEYTIKVFTPLDTERIYPGIYNDFEFILPTLLEYEQQGLNMYISHTEVLESATSYEASFNGISLVILEHTTTSILVKLNTSLTVGNLSVDCNVCYFLKTHGPFLNVSLTPTIISPETIPPEEMTITLSYAFATDRSPIPTKQNNGPYQDVHVVNSKGNFTVSNTVISESYFRVYYENRTSDRFFTTYYAPEIISITQSLNGTDFDIIAKNTGTGIDAVFVTFNGNGELNGIVKSIVSVGEVLINKITVEIPSSAVSGYIELYVDSQYATKNTTIKSILKTVSKPPTPGGLITITGSYLSGELRVIPSSNPLVQYLLDCSVTDPIIYICEIDDGSGQFQVNISNSNVFTILNATYHEPIINDVLPNNLYINSGEKTLTITGENFSEFNVTTVSIGGIHDNCIIIPEYITRISIQCNYTVPTTKPDNTLLEISVTVDSLIGSNNILQLYVGCPIGKDDNECSGTNQGTCKKESGECQCSKGFSGDSCSDIVQVDSSSQDISDSNNLKPLSSLFLNILITFIFISISIF